MKYELPVTLYQEKDCVLHHSRELAALGICALIITGKYSSRKNGSRSDVCQALTMEGRSYVIFDEIEENPSVETVERAAEFGRRSKVDFVIGIGGGSPLDAAKAVAVLLAEPPETGAARLYEPEKASGIGKVPKSFPVCLVPTTAGTGSEVTPYAILTLHKNRTKRGMSRRVFPVLSLADPRYLRTQSAEGRKATAVDTLAHLVESIINTKAGIYSRMFAMEGLRLWGSFRKALAKDALTDADFDRMLTASSLGGMAISHTGTSLPHGLSYPLTYELGTAHGKAAGIFLAGYLAADPEKGRQKEILDALMMKDCLELKEELAALLGTVELPEGLLQKDITELLQNRAKLANCPFPVTEEILFHLCE